MQKQKKSGPAIFMYIVIGITAVTAAVCLYLYYGGANRSDAILWIGIVSFMIMYHLWTRIIMGNVSKLFKINPEGIWFSEKPFEKKLYSALRVKEWKDKALTYNPESFSFSKHTPEEIVWVMTKSEVDHWINEIISLSSILFAFLWGKTWIFVLTAVLAMIFDAQFIVIQRYNRPRLLRIIEKKNAKKKYKPEEAKQEN